MRHRTRVLLTVFCLLLSLVGCQRGAASPFFYTEKDFCADLHGARGSFDLSCSLTVRKERAGRRIVLDYSSPASISGLVLSVFQSEGGALGEVSVCKDGLALALDASGVAGLLAPAQAMLEAREVVGLQKRADGALLVRFDGGELLLRKDGSPQALCTAELMLVVDRWEWIAEG